MSYCLLKRFELIQNNIDYIKNEYSINHDVSIVAVSKYASDKDIKEILSLNLGIALAESKAQVLRDKIKLYDFNNWHFKSSKCR